MKMKKIISAAIGVLSSCVLAVGIAACGHEHTYAKAWSSNETHHWKVATCEHDVNETEEEHQWDASHRCTVCKYQGTHTLSSEWVSNAGEDSHSKTCSVCHGQVTEYCTGGEATCSVGGEAICEVCGETYGELEPHAYADEWQSDASAHWKEATCGHDVNEMESAHTWNAEHKCTVCGYQNERTAHQFDTDTWVKDEGADTHGKTCSICSKVTENCSGGSATCFEKATCTACGEQYGPTPTHQYASDWTNDGNYHWHAAVCIHLGNEESAKLEKIAHTWDSEHKCTVCGYQGTHTYGAWEAKVWTDTHYKTCVCGNVVVEDCSGGNATCNELATCEVCSARYGDYQHEITGNACENCDYKAYVKVDEDGTENANGKYVLFGSYPQTKVTDETLNETLTASAGALPTADDAQSWQSYGYNGGTAGMWYLDVKVGGESYRGVYFTSYRDYTNAQGVAYQEKNGYLTSSELNAHVYWFKYEPVKWRILSEDASGKALILCELAIDAQDYQSNDLTAKNDGSYVLDEEGKIVVDDNGQKVVANNYAESTIRKWLNETFYAQAFDGLQRGLIAQAEVDNSGATTKVDANGENDFACDNTTDNVFLLSYADVMNTEYGFLASNANGDAAKEKKVSDYAQCQGAYADKGDGDGDWWLRSPDNAYGYNVSVVNGNGGCYTVASVQSDGRGVCPALYIQL